MIKAAADSPSWNSPTTTPLTSVWHQSISCVNFTASSVVKLVSITNISAITAAGSSRCRLWPCKASAQFQLPLSSKRSNLTPFLQFVRLKDYLVLGSLQPFSLGGWNKLTLPTPTRASISMQFIFLHAAWWLHQALNMSSLRLKLQLFRKTNLLYYCFIFSL